MPPTYCAPHVPYGAAKTDRIDRGPDRDYFRFQGKAGGTALLSIQSLTNGFDPRMVIRAPDGSVTETNGCNAPWNATCTFSVNLAVEQTGTFSVEFFDNWS